MTKFEKIANEMLDHMSEPDWCYAQGQGVAHCYISAKQYIKWCEALGRYPEQEAINHAQNKE